MRTSGGRGADAWMLTIPVLALVAASTMSGGGVEATLLTLESVVRQTVIASVEFIARLFQAG
jgi:hypothetical protein